MKRFSKNRLANAALGSFFYFFDRQPINKDFKILSVSCGGGYYEKFIYENYRGVNLTGTDVVDCFIKKEDLEFFRKAGIWNFVKVAPEGALPFPDSSFDLVYQNDVIEHVEKPFAFLKEQFRILRPGGRIIVGTPNLLRVANVGKILLGLLDFPKKIHEQGLYTTVHHQQEFTQWNIRAFLKEVGFTEIEVKCSFFGLPFGNIQLQAFPQRGMGRLLSHYLTISAIKPKIIG